MRRRLPGLVGILALLSISLLQAQSAVYRIVDYGAVCDGVTNDGPAIQAAINDALTLSNAALVLWPAKTCATTVPIVINNTSTQRFVSIVGVNPVQSQLKWIGTASGAIALTISHDLDFSLQNLGIINGAGSRADSIGLLLTADSEVGTRTFGATIDHLFVTGFSTCTQAGEYPNRATSEIVWTLYSATDCDRGWRNGSLNTLNHLFVMLELTNNGVGLDVGSGNAYIQGGAFHGNGIDLDVSNSGMTFEVADVRAETSGLFLRVTPSGPQNISVRNSMIGASTNADGVLISLSGLEVAVLDNNQIAGQVFLRDIGGRGELRMLGNQVVGDAVAQTPYGANPSSWSNGHLRVTSTQNEDLVSHARYPDEVADLSSGADLTNRLTMYAIPHATGAGAVNHLNLTRVASLAQGTLVVAHNLRLEETFGHSGTKVVPFIKTATVVTSAGSTTFTVIPADFNAADIGKQIVFVGADGHGGNLTCFIRFQNSTAAYTADHCVTSEGYGGSPISGSFGVRVGENEPDANYFLQIGCDKKEDIAWFAKTATGFTLKSSNSSSTATCDLILVR